MTDENSEEGTSTRMSDRQREYIAEYEKYKHIVIECRNYIHKNTRNKPLVYEVRSIDLEKDKVELYSYGNDITKYKSVHWCRKNLEVYDKEPPKKGWPEHSWPSQGWWF